jgi:SAM-dependent methyltransferase
MHQNRARADSFGDDAVRYDRTRPGYPSALFDDLRLSPGCTAVDVGCGTGIVAAVLLGRGCSVVGVEPDERMAEIARSKGVEVEISRFEGWDDEGRRFDVLTCGQAWHWVNPARGARKVAAILRSGGRFGIFWNGLTHQPDVAAGFRSIYSDLAPHLLVDSVALGTSRPSAEPDEPAFGDTGAFVHAEHRFYTWRRVYTSDTWIDELPTHSGHRVLPPTTLATILEEVHALVDRLGGEISVDYATAGLFGERR